MKKFDSFAQFLVYLLVAVLVTGVIVALNRHEEKVAGNTGSDVPAVFTE